MLGVGEWRSGSVYASGESQRTRVPRTRMVGFSIARMARDVEGGAEEFAGLEVKMFGVPSLVKT